MKDVITEDYQLLFGDCLERMKEIPDGSVDLVLTDPPYGTTACKWDSVIPFEPMWEQLKRIIKRLDRIEEKQDRTLEQTTKTNGRVTRLEQGYDTLCDDVNSLNSVKDETKGRDKVLWVILGGIGVIVVQLVNHFLNK